LTRPALRFALVLAGLSRMPHHGTPCGGSLSVPWRHSTTCSPRAPSLPNYTTPPQRRQGQSECPSGTLASVAVLWSCGTACKFTRPSPTRHCGAVWVRCARGTRAGLAGRRRRHVAALARWVVAASGNDLQRQQARVWGCGTAVPPGTRTAVRERDGKQGGRHRVAPSTHTPAYSR
jgi:hypothetical protein